MQAPLGGLWVARLALLAVLFGVGCRSVPPVATATPGATATPVPATPVRTDDVPSPTPTEEAPTQGGTLVIGVPAEPDVLNFSLASSPVSFWILSCLDARLIRIRDDNTLEPQLLADVPTLANGGISPDGLTYTLRFRSGLTWSDGDPLDGRDFVFTWHVLTNPVYPANARAGWELIQSAELSDDYLTVTVRLKQPAASFLEDVVLGIGERPSGFILPAHLFTEVPPAELVTSPYGATGHVSSGPFVVVDWQPGEHLTLERNPLYHLDDVRLDRIVFRFVPDERELLTQLASGELDLAVGLPEWAIAELHAQPELTVLTVPRGGAVMSFFVNLSDPADPNRPHPVLSDPRVRRALLLGFDRAELVDELFLGLVPVADSLLDNSLWQAAPVDAAPFDPDRARRLLDEAGWHAGPDGVRMRDGRPLQLTLAVDANAERDLALKRQIAAAFAEEMRVLGIDVHVVPLTAPAADRQYDLFLCWCDRRLTPSDLVALFHSAHIPTSEEPSAGNVTGYRNATVDALLARQAVTLDLAERRAAIAAIEAQLLEDLPVVPVYVHVDLIAARGHVKGIAPGPMTGIWWNPESWGVSPPEASP